MVLSDNQGSSPKSMLDDKAFKDSRNDLDFDVDLYLNDEEDNGDKVVIPQTPRTVFRFPPYGLAYPKRKLTMDEMLAEFINKGKREHEEMELFIREFITTNEILLKQQNNLLSELKIKVHELSRVMNDALFSKHDVKGVTTKGGKMTYWVTYNNEINKASDNHNEHSGFNMIFRKYHEKLL
ncbi:hypothetical protein Tco_0924425 [Tanacetum coccineum]|uniref:Uncharacterized protein n=1 Tax=Tanacetum coccineum TaxID=301880 RepID=A0ABQ5D700_9ASTR